jgi:general stress protein 26
MQQQLFYLLRNMKHLNIWNLTKVNGIHKKKPEKAYETKRNFTYDETKLRCFLCFAKQAKFRVSRNKKDAKWKPYTNSIFFPFCLAADSVDSENAKTKILISTLLYS